MKYANLLCDDLFTIKEELYNDSLEKVWNVGDYIQILAIENLYKRMKLDEHEIVRIRMQELRSYQGEKLLLPINLIVYGDNFFSGSDMTISDDIVPVFLGVRFFHYYFSETTKQYLTRFGPVGCRDESVLERMRELGIPAYLAGCTTITFPRREGRVENGKVYLVDIPEELRSYIPQTILANSVEETSVYRMSKKQLLQGKTMRQFVEDKYEEYYNNASLIITSRLHVASPCLAAGIPVILARNSVSDRFAWLDKFIKIYSASEFAKIDWNPSIPDMEREKEKIIETQISIIENQYQRYAAMEMLHQLYSNRKRCNYESSLLMTIDPIIEYVNKHWNKEQECKYAIWGWSVFAEEIVKYIKQHYPKARLVTIFDSYRTFEKYGVKAELPEGLSNNGDYVTFITSDAVAYFAEEYFKQHAENPRGYILMKCGKDIQ